MTDKCHKQRSIPVLSEYLIHEISHLNFVKCPRHGKLLLITDALTISLVCVSDPVYYVFTFASSQKEITGNMDRNTAEGRILDPPILARYFRINPTAWYGRLSMRVELFGCREGMSSFVTVGTFFIFNAKGQIVNCFQSWRDHRVPGKTV